MAAVELTDALREMSAVGEGSRSRLPLYHANIDWRRDETMTDAQKARAVDRLGEELGLAGQPRVVVEHVKDGREHLHVVWSRIDGETLRAIPDSHNYRKHEIVARELEREFEHTRVQGAHHERDGVDRPPRCPTLGDTRQAERSGMTAEEAKAHLRELWQSADSGQAFAAALDNAGWTLAQGDRRGFVALDPTGEVRAVNKAVTGLTAAQVRERFGDLDPGQLPTVDQARDQLRKRQQQPEPTPGPERKPDAEARTRSDTAALAAEMAAMQREMAEHEASLAELDAVGEAVLDRFRQQEEAINDAERQAACEETLAPQTQQRGDNAAANAARATEDPALTNPVGKSPEEMRREWADLMRGGVSAAARHEAENTRADPTPDTSATQGREQKPDPTAERAAWADRLRGFASEPAPEPRRKAEPARERQRTLRPDKPAPAPEKERVRLFQKLRNFVRGWFEAAPQPTPQAAPSHDRAADRERKVAVDRQAELTKPVPARQVTMPEPQPDRTTKPEQEKARPVERFTKRDFADELLAEARARLANQTPDQRAEHERSQADQSRGRGDGSRERTRHHHSPLWALAHPSHDNRARDHYRRPEP